MKATKLLMAVVPLILLLSACERGQSSSLQSDKGLPLENAQDPRSEQISRGRTAGAAGVPDVAAEPGQALQEESAPGISKPALSSQAGPTGPTVSDLPGPKVIKTADIEVRVGEGRFQEKFSRASVIAEEFGGFVTGSSTSETRGKIASGTVTIRVPSERFQQALAALRGLGKVRSEHSSGADVTGEFVDLEGRLKHLKSQEAFFLRLMDQAKTISDMIQIQQQLSSVQLQIEEVQGRFNLLKDQTSFSTINVRIFEPGVVTTPPKGLGKAWNEAIDGFRTIVAGVIVAAGWVAPFALLLLGGNAAWKFGRGKIGKQSA